MKASRISATSDESEAIKFYNSDEMKLGPSRIWSLHKNLIKLLQIRSSLMFTYMVTFIFCVFSSLFI